jgi:hypothetical protein
MLMTQGPLVTGHPLHLLTYADVCWRMLTYADDTGPAGDGASYALAAVAMAGAYSGVC